MKGKDFKLPFFFTGGRFSFCSLNDKFFRAGYAFLLFVVGLCSSFAQNDVFIPSPFREGETSQQLPQASLYAPFFVKRMPEWRNPAGDVPRWQEIGPLVIKNGWGGMDNAGRMTGIAVHPHNSNIIYAAAASGGLWKSTDRAKSWKPIADFEASLSYGAIAIDPFNPNIIYAGTGEPHYSLDSFHGTGFLKSRDGGETWESLGVETFIGQRFTRIIPHPRRKDIVFASTTGGLYRSIDGGYHWSKLMNGPVSDFIVHPWNPNAMIAAIGYPWGFARNGLYKSTDGGDTWKKLTRDLPYRGEELGRLHLELCQAFPNVVYASMYGSSRGLRGLHKSTDFGETWVRLPSAPSYAGDTAWYYNCIAVSPTNPNVIFLGGYSTFRSLDGGVTWEDNTRSYAGGPIHPDHHAYGFDPNDSNTLYLCTDGGIFRTRDLGNTWESVSYGLGTVQFQYVDVHPTDPKIAYGGTQDNGTNKYIGTPEWLHIFTGDGGTTRVNWENPNIVYTEYINLTICKSYDGGNSWQWDVTRGIDKSEGTLFYAPFNLDPSNPDVLVAGTSRVYRSEDGAGSWKPISPPLGGLVSAVTIAPSVSSVIYAGTTSGKVWVTPNLGGEWYDISRNLPRSYVSDIAIHPRNARIVIVAFLGWEKSRIWKSTDAGGSWTDISDNLPQAPVRMIAFHPERPEMIFIATEVGVFVSTKGGGKWMRFGRGLPNTPVFTIVANSRTRWITAGTHGRGAWRIELPE
ncbi:MAG TPA: hypothetical protein VNK96_07005 [Fimbriimonadales bacterium]|nr:hypothetical protein [Fimbriimonadales bacterium]